MDQNNWNNQNRGNGDWDRWNSNASNSSYYNQPTHRPYGQSFSIASAICGILAMMTSCTVVLSMCLGSLGILFAVLAHRKGKRMNSTCVTGLTLSCIGVTFAVVILVYTYVMLPLLMKNEAFSRRLDTVSEQMYGISFSELMEEYYGFSFEE